MFQGTKDRVICINFSFMPPRDLDINRRTDGQQSVPFLPFEVRNPKKEKINKRNYSIVEILIIVQYFFLQLHAAY